MTPTSTPAALSPSLWWMGAAPALWIAHVLACYVTVALACGRWSGADSGTATHGAIAAYTVAAVTGMTVCLFAGLRARRDAAPMTRLDDDTPDSRRHFMAAAMVLLALLSIVGTLFVAAATRLVPSCA